MRIEVSLPGAAKEEVYGIMRGLQQAVFVIDWVSYVASCIDQEPEYLTVHLERAV